MGHCTGFQLSLRRLLFFFFWYVRLDSIPLSDPTISHFLLWQPLSSVKARDECIGCALSNSQCILFAKDNPKLTNFLFSHGVIKRLTMCDNCVKEPLYINEKICYVIVPSSLDHFKHRQTISSVSILYRRAMFVALWLTECEDGEERSEGLPVTLYPDNHT